MSDKTLNTKQGHWLLAKMGKKVLRPGGMELTNKMIKHLNITPKDNVVEFAPGLGHTAKLTLTKKPKTYTGVEVNEEAAALTTKNIHDKNAKIIIANASETTLPDACATKVYAEAMLSMQPEHKKREIIKEAARILEKGGLYGIHELGLTPNELDFEIKDSIRLELAKAINVNARPLTVDEWKEIIESEGFIVREVETNPMHLLEFKRMIQDEGFLRFLKIVFNIMRNGEARKRIKKMRSTFKKHEKNLNAVSIVAEKN